MVATAEIFTLAARVAGIGVTVTGLEFSWAVPGLARWRRSERSAGPGFIPGHRLLALVLAGTGISFVAMPRLCLAGGGLAAMAVVAYFVIVFQPMGDGADVMLMLVLAGVGAVGLMPRAGMVEWAGWCVAANVCLAYWWSGVAKLRVPAWRTGRQVALAINSPRYGAPMVAWRFLNHAWLARLTSWSVIVLEASCPVFLFLGGWALLAWAVCALAMHVAVALIMGLGRFLWAFSAGLAAMVAVRALV